MSEELSKDNKVEELAEALAGGIEQEPVKEAVEVEIKLDEEDTVEASEELVESEAVEEVAAEVAEEAKKSRKALKIVAISLLATLGVLAGVYFGMANKYSECFLMGTIVNGNDCSGLTVDEVGNILQKQVEEYVLTIEGSNGAEV